MAQRADSAAGEPDGEKLPPSAEMTAYCCAVWDCGAFAVVSAGLALATSPPELPFNGGREVTGRRLSARVSWLCALLSVPIPAGEAWAVTVCRLPTFGANGRGAAGEGAG